MVSTAPTCGLTKGGRPLIKIDPATGLRLQEPDPDTGETIDAINDKLLEDMIALRDGQATDTLRFVPAEKVGLRTAVPVYYDQRYTDAFTRAMGTDFPGLTAASIGDLIKGDVLEVRHGHGSPSQDVRVGAVPYIKVSDLRAGLVNINPTNRVPLAVAQQYWHGSDSGLRAWDLICPERTSKNIGDFCLLLPGQEQIVATKEILVLRPGKNADFDAFYLTWAMTLTVVRDQWRRIVFMQTNREDVGDRYFEILIPMPPDASRASEVSKPFAEYYTRLAEARAELRAYLDRESRHHFFIGGADEPIAVDDEEAAIERGSEEAQT